MADPADVAEREMEREAARRSAEQSRMALERETSGKSTCACGEGISERRMELGAFRCMDCQEAVELG